MLQLMDLAKENAALRSELDRLRREAEALQRLLLEAEEPTSARTTPRFRQMILAAAEEL
jgi:hypothetical protein